MAGKPSKITLRMYQVGFGDCFLLSFTYPEDAARHVLIDFGTTKLPPNVANGHMVRVAEHIKATCGKKLHAVVATHRHKDHISGFSTDGNSATGKIIAECAPDFVIQPWTEDLAAAPDALGPTAPKNLSPTQQFVSALNHMHSVARMAVREAPVLAGTNAHAAAELEFLGDDNLSNRSAVDNLATMGSANVKRRYAKFGDDLGLDKTLPGVKVSVLGPPSLEQSDEIRKERLKDPVEFWQLHRSFWDVQSRAADASVEDERGVPQPIFKDFRPVKAADAPPGARWFIERMQLARSDLLLELVRVLDDAMNNTSLILLFEASNKKFLFAGDAQIENWSYALGKDDVRALLKDVHLYKVGHHGSRNATPKESLWPLFAHRSPKKDAGRLTTVMSTLEGKHGSIDKNSEVPRRTLVEALQRESNLLTTEDMAAEDLCRTIEFDL